MILPCCMAWGKSSPSPPGEKPRLSQVPWTDREGAGTCNYHHGKHQESQHSLRSLHKWGSGLPPPSCTTVTPCSPALRLLEGQAHGHPAKRHGYLPPRQPWVRLTMRRMPPGCGSTASRTGPERKTLSQSPEKREPRTLRSKLPWPCAGQCQEEAGPGQFPGLSC